MINVFITTIQMYNEESFLQSWMDKQHYFSFNDGEVLLWHCETFN